MTAAAATADGHYAAGVKAYRAGQYSEALKRFTAARRKGMDSANLEFNLGLTYFRLGRLDEARATFEQLRHNLSYAPAADYHLGLIAAQLGEADRAQYHLGAARTLTTDTALRALADDAMQSSALLEVPRVGEDGAAPDVVSYYLLAGSGYDTNPSLVSESVQQAEESNNAAYFELSGDARRPLTPRRLKSTAVFGSLRLRDYSGQEAFDETSGELGLRRSFRGRTWRAEADVSGGADSLGGDVFQRVAAAQVDLRRALATGGEVGFDLRTERIAGGDGFGYLDGWRHRAGAALTVPAGRWAIRGAYDYSVNDRDDLSTGVEFFSHSPHRQAVGISVGRWLGGVIGVEWRARYRESRYADADRFVRDGSLVRERRVEELVSTGLRTRVLIGRGWNWLIDYQFSDNGASREPFEYERHLLLLGVEWLR